jgi:hypothetical protein
MIPAITEKQKSLIVNNIVKACDDIHKLNGTGYKYIYLASGFIAHYNIQGFKAHYDDEGFFTQSSLADDILANAAANRWDNFNPGDDNYEYYKSKADVYKRIVDKLSNKKLNLYNT